MILPSPSAQAVNAVCRNERGPREPVAREPVVARHTHPEPHREAEILDKETWLDNEMEMREFLKGRREDERDPEKDGTVDRLYKDKKGHWHNKGELR